MTPTRSKFFGGLESLRGIAALIVVLHHVRWPNPVASWKIISNGHLMVDLFFVLSGFVIYHNYHHRIKCGKDMLQFMFLRLGRLYPLHLTFLLLFLLLEFVKYYGETRLGYVPHERSAFSANNGWALAANALLIQPFFPSTVFSFNTPSWSIGVEFYTYLIFAAVVWLAVSQKMQGVWSLLLLLGAMAGLAFWFDLGLNSMAGLSFLRCLLGFFAGVLAYLAYDRFQEPLTKMGERLIWLTTAILIGFMLLNARPQFEFAVVPVFFILVMAVAAAPAERGPLARLLASGPFRWLGKISYSIYMSHLFILIILQRVFEVLLHAMKPGAGASAGLELLFVTLAVGIILGVSKITFNWIEKPGQQKARELSTRWF